MFPVKIARDAKVSALQEAIADRYKVVSNRVEVYPATLTLYLARKNGAWLKDDDNVKDFLRGKIDKQYKEMRPSWALNDKEYFGKKKMFQPGYKEIHILVELPEVAGVARGEREWSAKDSSTVDPQVQSNIWKSVVRISSAVCSGTALVVDRTPTHLYLLTNLRDDESFAYHLSDEFKVELERYSSLHPAMKTSGKRKNDTVGFLEPPIRKSAPRKASVFSPEILIEQLETSGMSMEEVLRFRLESGICWRSSAAFDFAILKLPRRKTSSSLDVAWPLRSIQRCMSRCLDCQALSKLVDLITHMLSSQLKSLVGAATKCFSLLCLLQVSLEVLLYARKGEFQLDILAVVSMAPRITSSFSRLASRVMGSRLIYRRDCPPTLKMNQKRINL